MVDGSGRTAFRADIIIQDGRIAGIGGPRWTQDHRCLADAEGLTVTPGFIDVHSHSDFTLNVDPRAVSSITQGVTLEIVGNCGRGCAPIRRSRNGQDQHLRYHSDFRSAGGPWPSIWRLSKLGSRLSTWRRSSRTETLRLSAADRLMSPRMRTRCERCANCSRRGGGRRNSVVSTGLEYGTGRGASGKEIAELCRVTRGCARNLRYPHAE